MKRAKVAATAALLAFLLCLTPAGYAGPAKSFTTDSLARIRSAHASKAIIVHVWGVTCGPCLAELPRWGDLLRRHPAMDLVLVQADQAPVRDSDRVLQQAGLGAAEHWNVSAPLDEFMRASIDPTWIGDLPRTLLIAPDGKVTRLRGVADLAEVERWWRRIGARH